MLVSSVHSDAGGDLLASRSDVIMAALSSSLRRPTVVVSLREIERTRPLNVLRQQFTSVTLTVGAWFLEVGLG